MWLETLAAIIFLGGLLPIWLPASVIYAIGAALFSFFIIALSMAQYGGASPMALILAPTDEALTALVALPSWGWNWAKFKHPAWALVIGMFAIAVMNSRD